MWRIFAFIVVAAALIWGGIWYNNKLDLRSADQLRADQERAKQVEAKIMENLKIEDVVVGKGDAVKNGDKVSVHYTGILTNGDKFDSSYDRGTPFEFTVGAGQVIRGWDLGLVGMKKGGIRNLTIPPELGYGNRPIGTIPANSTLKFTVELLSITPGQ